MKVTLNILNTNLAAATRQMGAVVRTDAEAVGEARENLRKAKEALRVFSYQAKPCFTRSGHALRP